MRIKYYNPLESYKEKQSAFPGDKIGRKERKHNESQLITDDDGNITYKEHITKEEIKNAITGESVYDETPDYDYEKKILDAINNDPDEEDIIAWLQYAQKYQTSDDVPFKKAPKDAKSIKDKDKQVFSTDHEDEYFEEENEEEGLIDEKDDSELQNNLYYNHKIIKAKKEDKEKITHKPKIFNPEEDKRHGRERIGDFKKSNRADRKYTKKALEAVYL